MHGIEKLVQRIQAEYWEMPGLSLTKAQAQRVWGLDELQCEAILDTLVRVKFLTFTQRGTFVRAA